MCSDHISERGWQGAGLTARRSAAVRRVVLRSVLVSCVLHASAPRSRPLADQWSGRFVCLASRWSCSTRPLQIVLRVIRKAIGASAFELAAALTEFAGWTGYFPLSTRSRSECRSAISILCSHLLSLRRCAGSECACMCVHSALHRIYLAAEQSPAEASRYERDVSRILAFPFHRSRGGVCAVPGEFVAFARSISSIPLSSI
eukprot:6206851-Pleurochrysis_carterae.AAC.2